LKRHVSDLACFGGPPAFDSPLHVGYPNVGDKASFLRRVEEIVDSRWLTNDGRFVQEFEQSIAEMMNVKHCVATCNGTVALELAIRACGIQGEVIVPGFTFVATAHAAQWQGIVPVFADIEPGGHHIDVAQAESCITEQTTGIIGVHLWGRPCNVKALTAVASSHGLRLILDAAHALGCSSGGETIGGFGDCEVLSFHATKVLHTLEGGAVLTNDDGLADTIRLMRNFGFSGYDEVSYVGTNGKMNEVSAAMGLTLLEQFHSIVAANEAIYRRYVDKLGDVPGLRVLEYERKERNNFQYVVLEVDDDETGITRDMLLFILWEENVHARRYFYPGCHRMEPYKSLQRYAGLSLPVTERVANRVLVLPTGPSLGASHVDLVADIIRRSIENHEIIGRRLAGEPNPWVAQCP
jgi:dTDP-4-amino-4,6-dideoxygalactose transaminase